MYICQLEDGYMLKYENGVYDKEYTGYPYPDVEGGQRYQVASLFGVAYNDEFDKNFTAYKNILMSLTYPRNSISYTGDEVCVFYKVFESLACNFKIYSMPLDTISILGLQVKHSVFDTYDGNYYVIVPDDYLKTAPKNILLSVNRLVCESLDNDFENETFRSLCESFYVDTCEYVEHGLKPYQGYSIDSFIVGFLQDKGASINSHVSRLKDAFDSLASKKSGYNMMEYPARYCDVSTTELCSFTIGSALGSGRYISLETARKIIFESCEMVIHRLTEFDCLYHYNEILETSPAFNGGYQDSLRNMEIHMKLLYPDKILVMRKAPLLINLKLMQFLDSPARCKEMDGLYEYYNEEYFIFHYELILPDQECEIIRDLISKPGENLNLSDFNNEISLRYNHLIQKGYKRGIDKFPLSRIVKEAVLSDKDAMDFYSSVINTSVNRYLSTSEVQPKVGSDYLCLDRFSILFNFVVFKVLGVANGYRIFYNENAPVKSSAESTLLLHIRTAQNSPMELSKYVQTHKLELSAICMLIYLSIFCIQPRYMRNLRLMKTTINIGVSSQYGNLTSIKLKGR